MTSGESSPSSNTASARSIACSTCSLRRRQRPPRHQPAKVRGRNPKRPRRRSHVAAVLHQRGLNDRKIKFTTRGRKRGTAHVLASSILSRCRIKALVNDNSNSRRRATLSPAKGFSRSGGPLSFAFSASILFARARASSAGPIRNPKLNPRPHKTLPAPQPPIIKLQQLSLPPTRRAKEKADPPPIAKLPMPDPDLANQSILAFPKPDNRARRLRPDYTQRP